MISLFEGFEITILARIMIALIGDFFVVCLMILSIGIFDKMTKLLGINGYSAIQRILNMSHIFYAIIYIILALVIISLILIDTVMHSPISSILINSSGGSGHV